MKTGNPLCQQTCNCNFLWKKSHLFPIKLKFYGNWQNFFLRWKSGCQVPRAVFSKHKGKFDRLFLRNKVISQSFKPIKENSAILICVLTMVKRKVVSKVLNIKHFPGPIIIKADFNVCYYIICKQFLKSQIMQSIIIIC